MKIFICHLVTTHLKWWLHISECPLASILKAWIFQIICQNDLDSFSERAYLSTKTYEWGCIAESFWCRFWCEDILKGMPNELSNQAFCYFLAVEESSLLVLSVDVRLMGFCAAFCSWLFTKGAISLAPSYYLVRTPLTLKANTSFEVRSVKNRKLQSRQNMFSWPSKQV